MTDTLHKNPESCTGYPTPETDAEASNGSFCDQCVPIDFAHKLCRERDEAVRSCHIWQTGHSKLVADRDDWKSFAVKLENAFKIENDALRKQLAIVTKQNNKQLTILQENGLAEYGN